MFSDRMFLIFSILNEIPSLDVEKLNEKTDDQLIEIIKNLEKISFIYNIEN